MKKTISTFLIYFLLLSSYAIAGESELITLIDFGVSENSNIYEFSDWTAPVKDVYTDYYDIGPGGTSVAVGNNGSYNYQGVQGGDTEFKAGEKITVTWYNNSDTAVSFIPRISFDDPNRQGSYEPTGDWYDMNEITISPNTGGQTVFEFDDSSAGIYSLVNVSMTYNVEKEVLICDKIELAWTENQGLITYDGGTVSSDDGLVTVIFPQGSVHENVFITIFPLVGCTIPFKSDFEFISTVYKIIAENEQGQLVNNFNKDIEITIKYDPDAIRGLNEENFEIDYYDETENQWITLTSKINLVNYTLTTTTDYPGEFAILAGTAPETAVRKIDLRKNPNKLRHLFPNTMEDLKNNPVIVLDDYNELKIVSITEDSSDSGYVKYRQYFRGVPLQGFQVTVALMSDGELKIRGFLMEGIDLHIRDVTPAFDEDTALVSMKSRHRQDNGITADLNYRNERCELIIYTDEENAAYLTYEVSFFAASQEAGIITRPYFILDAKTEEILEQWDGLANIKVGTGPGGNKKTGKYYYDGPNDDNLLDVTVATVDGEKKCIMENERIKTIDCDASDCDILKSDLWALFDADAYSYKYSSKSFSVVSLRKINLIFRSDSFQNIFRLIYQIFKRQIS